MNVTLGVCLKIKSEYNEAYSQRRICLFFSNSFRLVGLRAWQKGSTIKLPLILLNYYIVIKIAKIVDIVGKYV